MWDAANYPSGLKHIYAILLISHKFRGQIPERRRREKVTDLHIVEVAELA